MVKTGISSFACTKTWKVCLKHGLKVKLHRWKETIFITSRVYTSPMRKNQTSDYRLSGFIIRKCTYLIEKTKNKRQNANEKICSHSSDANLKFLHGCQHVAMIVGQSHRVLGIFIQPSIREFGTKKYMP